MNERGEQTDQNFKDNNKKNSFLTSGDDDPFPFSFSLFLILQLLLTSAFTYVIGIAVALFQRIKYTKLI